MVYPISRFIVTPIYKLWLRKVEGLENVPKDKPFIIAANHSSYFDIFIPPILIAPKVNKKIHALVNSYYWKNLITGYFLDMWEAIPVFVGKGHSKQKNKSASAKAIKYLKNNELIMIFPEGSRSKDGKLKKAYNGIAKICLRAKVPVLPVGIIGANEVMPVGKMLPRLRRCEVKIGKLMYFDKYYNKRISDKAFRNITRSIMKEIARLIGQKYSY